LISICNSHQLQMGHNTSEEDPDEANPVLSESSAHAQLASLSDGTFTLAALHASGLLPEGKQVNVLRLLRLSARSGSMEAQLALADRLLSGRGVPKRCWAGLR
jgi:TPR repeat protein